MDRHIEALKVLKAGTVIPATPLVLDENRLFDEQRQRLITRYYLEAGAGGIATAVHSTQFEIRLPEYELFEPVISTVSDEIGRYEKETGRAVVKVSGVCGKTEQAAVEAETAKRNGFDAVLLSPGGLNDRDEEYLLERAEAVSKVLPVIGFYLQPSVGGRVFTYSFWERFCEIGNVAAIKIAPFSRYHTLDVVRACALSSRCDEITLYTGNDDNIVPDLITRYSFTKEDGSVVTKGIDGGLLGHWCVWTRSAVKLFERIRKEGAAAELLTLGAQITDANAAIFDAAHSFAGCIPGIHEILRRQGLLKGIWCLDPDEVLSEGQAEEIDRIYRMYPHLNDDAFVREFLSRYTAYSR